MGECSVLVLLDLNAAFDTVDHHILGGWLSLDHHWTGSPHIRPSGPFWLELKSFHISHSGVPQVSVLGSLRLFALFLVPLGANNKVSPTAVMQTIFNYKFN